MTKDDKFNISNVLALLRIITFPVVLYFIIAEDRQVSAILYIIFFSTDVLDGATAILFNLESNRRQKLDTIGDILFLLTGLTGLFIFESSFAMNHLEWIILVIGIYFTEFILSLLRFRKPSFFHTYSAKVAAFLQVAFLVYTLFFTPLDWLFYVALAASVLDALEDIIIVFKLKEYRTNIKGIYWLDKG